MEYPNTEFLAPAALAVDALMAQFARRWRLAEEPVRDERLVFLDTFDWGLYGNGGILEWRGAGRDGRLYWRALDPSLPVLSQPGPEPSGFAADLPAGAVRGRIERAAGIRRLLPRMVVSVRMRTLRLLDDEDKTRVRIQIEEHSYQDPETDRAGPLTTRLQIQPLRGYEDEGEIARQMLEGEFDLAPAETPLLIEALTAAGRQASDYSSKIDFDLYREETAGQVTRAILRSLLDTLERNLAGARASLDSEFLHDLRVAVRRTRSALSQIRGTLPAAVVAHYKERFAWLQTVTGPVRDLDVYLLDFDAYRQALPEPMRPHLEPLRAFILAHYDIEQARLADTLASPECADLLRAWRLVLDAEDGDDASAPHARKPVKRVADRRIWRMLKLVRKEGQAIRPDSPAEQIHELRKSCKKLRYLIEFFQSLYPQELIRAPIRLLKVLLDNLGDFQDQAVQAAHLRDLAVRMAGEGVDTDTLLAIGALIGDLFARQHEARQRFAQVFDDFMADDNQALLRTLLTEPDRPASVDPAPTGDEGRQE